MIGAGTKEYEKTVRVDGLEIPESELQDYYKQKKERAAAGIKPQRLQNTPALTLCPFSTSQQSCRREKCALYTGASCSLARIAERAEKDTAGLSCPFSAYPCRRECGLYKNGCVLTAAKERK
jgi:hypothetical protein